MIEVIVEDAALKNIEQKLGEMASKAPTVVKKAVNDTAKAAKKELALTAKATYTVKKANFTGEMKIKSATTGKREAVIEASGEPLPLIRFKVSAGKKTTKVQVLKVGTLKELKSKKNKRGPEGIKAFVNNIARKGQIRSRDTKKGKAGTAVIHKAVAQREGKERLGINEKYSNSIPMMLGSKRVFGEKKEDIAKILRKNLEKHIAIVLEN